MMFLEASAKNNFNVEQAFRDLGAAAVKRQASKEVVNNHPVKNAVGLEQKKKQEPAKKAKCC